MRFLLFFMGATIIFACNNSAKKTDNHSDTGKTQRPAEPVSPAHSSNDTIFRGMGTEPFWAIYVINNQKILYHPAEGADIEVPFVTPSNPDAVTRKFQSSNDSITMELTIIKKSCNNGMSDIVYPYEIGLLINAVKYSGCGTE